MPDVENKNVLFGCFGQQFENLLSYLKLFPLNLSYSKVWCKNKNPEIWYQKCPSLLSFGWNLKVMLLYLESTPSNLSNCMQAFVKKYKCLNVWLKFCG